MSCNTKNTSTFYSRACKLTWMETIIMVEVVPSKLELKRLEAQWIPQQLLEDPH